MAEFSPSELDQIEDLLEDLETGAGLEDESLSPAARERLDEYRDILALSRDALPLEEPDPNLLAGVIAEARQTAFNSKSTAAGVVSSARQVPARESEDSRPSWFRRWLPAMALAGSAVAVLLLLRPQAEEDGAASEAPATLAQNDRPASPAKTTLTQGSVDADKVAQAAPGEAGVEEPEDSETEPAQEAGAAVAEDVEPAAKSSRKSVSNSRAPAKAKSDAVQEPLEEEPTVDKDQAWGDLVRAHGLRRRGECRGARALYRGLEHEGLKDNVRAQAIAGRGLCDEFDGETSSAESSYSKARDIRRDIDGWIEAERQEMRANGHMRKKKAKPAPSKKSKRKAKTSKQGF
jgi:hypothetical protein